MDTQDHIREARYFLAMADHPVVVANAQHRSEILWGAATQMVKAVAKDNNLPNDSHREMFRAVRNIGNSINYPTLVREFGQADKLHKNFYNGEMSPAEFSHARRRVHEFVSILQRILNAP